MFSAIESRLLALLESVAKASRQLLTGIRSSTSRAADSRRDATHLRDQAASVDRGRDTKLEHQARADGAPRAKTAE
ncbi:hypothetical protein [Mycolicibacterium psychrotolerans]|uniref:Uncharacterized protein n=1 Tax=Mycolicibacterium psychrotolerans TaxID=216929 RepID=A0A7I7M375_9MYCO|nr:hypothetical protein [Mycolicibacterium psychrotolerans]BBX66614.1 hypothetical protein MPSYJ_00750 [Mycolicibacterium psychrotolerans]